ncbi:sensor histidine kinase [Hyalangium versicolor]|uniref:sensor histidine kinase n=1 Tax=Hyalangium versicolor TaxID=2861190 RepID=UPI001CCA1683|nr:ATP-binding protein [Hyalangium versicolor]
MSQIGVPSASLLPNHRDAHRSEGRDARDEGIDTALFEQMAEGVTVFRRDATYRYVNAFAERLLGKSRQELVEHCIWDVFPGAGESAFHRAFLQVVETGHALEIEHCYKPWDRWFRQRLYLRGELIYVFSQDVTEQKRAELERAESYQFTEQLYEQARLAQQRAAFLARASEVLASSLDSDEILRSLAYLAVPTLGDWCAVDVATDEGAVRRVATVHLEAERLAQGEAFQAKYPVTLEDPHGIGKVLRTGISQYVLEVSDELLDQSLSDPERRHDVRELGVKSIIIVPLSSRGRTLAALSLIYADSNRRYTQADVQLAEDLARRAATSLDNGLLYKEAQEAIQARDSFLSVASHELNTPLTSLSLNIQALQRALQQASAGSSTPLQETATVKLQAVHRQISRLANLIHELLDVSRITAGKLRLEPEEVELTSLTRELVPRFAEDLSRAGCELRMVTPEAPVVGYWDRLRVEQVLQNLLSNALKYGPGFPIQLHISADARSARVVVKDKGIGISIEDQSRLFQRFERLASERHYSGFGLGLWIVRQILDAMGGSIHVESAPGQGSVFTVELPLRPPPLC